MQFSFWSDWISLDQDTVGIYFTAIKLQNTAAGFQCRCFACAIVTDEAVDSAERICKDRPSTAFFSPEFSLNDQVLTFLFPLLYFAAKTAAIFSVCLTQIRVTATPASEISYLMEDIAHRSVLLLFGKKHCLCFHWNFDNLIAINGKPYLSFQFLKFSAAAKQLKAPAQINAA